MKREQFPVLATCVYLNSNSTGATPLGVRAVLDRYWETVSQWRDEAWGGWLAEMDGYVAALAEFLGAPAGTVVIDANLTTLLGRLGTCFDFTGGRDRVVLSDREFPTVEFLWKGFARYGAVPVVADDLLAAIDERTRLVCVTHASYRTGALTDLARVVERANQCGAQVIVDAFQSVGVVPLDVKALGVDFVLGGAHKWMCGAHTAFLYVREDLLPGLRPAATGWFAGSDPLSFGVSEDWAADARRMAGGTPIPLTAMMSRVGLDLLREVDVDAIRAHSLRCTDRVVQHADDMGVPVLTPREPSRRGGVVTLDLPKRVKESLAARGMIGSWRDGLRIAPHFYNTLDEVDLFMAALREVR